jgi:hypothetical protein
MKCGTGLNHQIPHLCPSVCPTGLRVTSELREQISISGWGCILFTTSTVAGAEILYIHMKQICYDYEVGGGYYGLSF